MKNTLEILEENFEKKIEETKKKYFHYGFNVGATIMLFISIFIILLF